MTTLSEAKMPSLKDKIEAQTVEVKKEDTKLSKVTKIFKKKK